MQTHRAGVQETPSRAESVSPLNCPFSASVSPAGVDLTAFGWTQLTLGVAGQSKSAQSMSLRDKGLLTL